MTVPRVLPNTLVPPIAEPVTDLGSLVQVVRSLRLGLQSLGGQRGNTLDRAVTWRDLVALGLVPGAAPFATTASTVSGGGSSIYRIALFTAGLLDEGQVLLRHTVADSITISADMAGSEATAGVGATGTCVLGLQVALGGSAPNTFAQVGTFTFTGSDVGVVATVGGIRMDADDVLQVVCISADTTLADVSLTIAASIV